MRQQLGDFLQENGYAMIPSNLPEFTIYYQIEHNFVNVIHVVEDREGLYLANDQFEHVKDTIYQLFESKGLTDVHILSIIISEDVEKVKQVASADTFCWMLEPNQRRLIIYENQVADFYGFKSKIEDWLLQGCPVTEQENNGNEEPQRVRKRFKIADWRELSYVTITITLLNILVFLICTFTGNLLYNIGALNTIDVFHEGEYYRILTCMFLHADIHHLFSNMVILYFLGELVEKKLGHIRYLIVYMAAGIGGGLLSMGYGCLIDNYIDSIGASGAIFGIIGALLWLVLTHKSGIANITLGKVLFLIIYSLYCGFTATNIDNAAHIGGLVVGFLFTFIVRSVGNEG